MTIGATKLATQVLQKAMENSSQESLPLQNGPSSFQEVLQNTDEVMAFADILGGLENPSLQGPAQAISATDIPVDADAGTRHFDSGSDAKIVDLLADFNQQQMHMDGLVSEILYGNKKFTNQELMAMQAHVFRVAQLTELAVKSVELTISSFKGVMNTQIQ